MNTLDLEVERLKLVELREYLREQAEAVKFDGAEYAKIRAFIATIECRIGDLTLALD